MALITITVIATIDDTTQDGEAIIQAMNFPAGAQVTVTASQLLVSGVVADTAGNLIKEPTP